ncbi:putative RNA-directed DNA polymerase [Helianthus annuus]|nr:putative RNA-directed DNA polymerase [Helianthus annuus]KAJ0748444.1 putative RNA-directed DNA polymerase [Helianthus annuus]
MGDENTSFFHAVVNSHKARNRINGLWIEGSWISDANVIKEKFMLAFKEKFKEPINSRPRMGMDGFKRLNERESSSLIEHFKEDEVRNAIWECGGDKAPGPDGITFSLIKMYWEELKPGIMDVMQQFFIHGSLHHSCSSSFIALIPKVTDPMVFSDFRPISLVGVINKIISKVLAIRMKNVLNSVVSCSQSAFISGRNIIDGPLIINEIVGWAKKAKKEMFIFKADIEKAYDTLNWKFLISILAHMGFPPKWRNWVMGILFTGRGSILVNGAPTGEFQYKRGLRQGDPLSPFLFIVAMEALHVMMTKAKEEGIFSGVKLPGENLMITHLLYADDSIFVGEWEENNMKNLKRILRCFNLISGLKINPSKSQLFGVGLEEEEITMMAETLGFKPGKFPFTYLGLKVGANMNRVNSWKEVIDTFNRRLSSWKAKLLSFAGRVILLKAVLGSLPNYYLSLYKCPITVIKVLEGIRRKFLWGGCNSNKKMRWVKWEKIVAAKKFGGLGVGCIRDLNLALLVKWWWRLKTEPQQLWAKVINAIHKNKRRISMVPLRKDQTGIWKTIVETRKDLLKRGVEIEKHLISKIGSGDKTLFWIDIWVGEIPLRDKFPLLYQLAKDKRVNVKDCYKQINGGILWDWAWLKTPSTDTEKLQMELMQGILNQARVSTASDRWIWKGEDNLDFSVKNVRSTLSRSIDLNEPADDFFWNNWAAQKCSMFVWRAIKGKIPTATKLKERGVPILTEICKVCNMEEETPDHVLVNCRVAEIVWEQVNTWVKATLARKPVTLEEVFKTLNNANWPKVRKKAVHAIYLLTSWVIWRNRNEILFRARDGEVYKMIEEIKEESYQWMKQKAKLRLDSWEKWMYFTW